MKLNNKIILSVFTALVVQLSLGIDLVNAMQCEREIEQEWESLEINNDGSRQFTFNQGNYVKTQSLDEVKSMIYDDSLDFVAPPVGQEYKWGPNKESKSCKEWAYFKYKGAVYYKSVGGACIAKYIAENNCKNLEVFKYKKGSNQQSSSNNSSSKQSASAETSNSPESYNIQVSQNNKQNYQAMQGAYEQANAGKGKKHNKEANATECMKNNPAQKSFKNNCNQPINFTYCFSGTVSGAKNESPQTLVELNCQGGQFGTLTVGPGENIPGSYTGLALDGLACKSPSQPVDMTFDRSANAATGRCSF